MKETSEVNLPIMHILTSQAANPCRRHISKKKGEGDTAARLRWLVAVGGGSM